MNETNTRPAQEASESTASSEPVRQQEREARVQPSGYTGGNPSTAGAGPTGVQSSTPENKHGHINPSAPANTGTTPDSTAER